MKSPAVPIGSPAPSFSLPDPAGAVHRLGGPTGRALVLVFYRGHW